MLPELLQYELLLPMSPVRCNPPFCGTEPISNLRQPSMSQLYLIQQQSASVNIICTSAMVRHCCNMRHTPNPQFGCVHKYSITNKTRIHMVLRAHFKRLTTFTQEFWQYVHRTAPLHCWFSIQLFYCICFAIVILTASPQPLVIMRKKAIFLYNTDFSTTWY